MRLWGCKEFRWLSSYSYSVVAGRAGVRARERALAQKRIVSASAAQVRSRMRTILLIILILLLVGAYPGWGYSSGWGYYPFGGIGLVLLIVLILALMGKL